MVARGCLLAFLILAIVASVPLRAQAPQSIPAVSEIRKLLESSEPRDQAWGCWWAMQANARELSPEIERVATSTGAVKFPDTLAIDAAADALVQLNVKLPATVAIALYERRPTQALILLSRAGDDANPVLVNLVRTAQGVRWLAATNLAINRRAPGVGAALLEDIEIQAKVFVQDSPLKSSGSAVSLGSFSVSDGIAVNDRAYPPLTEYYMDATPLPARPGQTMLAPGTTSVYFTRFTIAPGQQGGSYWHDQSGPSTTNRLDAIGALLDPFQPLRLKASEWKNVVWRTQADLDREVVSFRADLVGRFESIIDRLVAGKLLTDAEARAVKRPAIVVGVEDMRGKRMQQASKLFASRFFASRLFLPVLLCSCSPVLPGPSPSVLESSSVLPALP